MYFEREREKKNSVVSYFTVYNVHRDLRLACRPCSFLLFQSFLVLQLSLLGTNAKIKKSKVNNLIRFKPTPDWWVKYLFHIAGPTPHTSLKWQQHSVNVTLSSEVMRVTPSSARLTCITQGFVCHFKTTV